jgi:hypothetical protein
MILLSKGGSMKSKKSLYLFMMVISFATDARFHLITNRRKYQEFVDEYDYAVVCFIDSRVNGEDLLKKKKHKNFVSIFKDSLKRAAMTDPYKHLLKQEIGFLYIDISTKSGAEIFEDYRSSADVPFCVLLERNNAIENALLQGFSSQPHKQKFLHFLEEHAEYELAELVEKKEEQLAQQRAERIALYQAQGSYYGLRPWGGWAPAYYGYGAYGVHPYYSPYYYPHAHVGFSIYL